MNSSAESFPKRWTIANTLALLLGYVLYTPIAHGVTGSHPEGLSARQVLSHSVALAVIAIFVAAGQRRELGRHVQVPWSRLSLATIGFIAAFWAGVYQPWLRGPDFDILFGSFVLGNAVWVGLISARGHWIASVVALLAFPVACFLGQLLILGVVVATGMKPDLQSSQLQHSVYWISVGLSMGTVGGSISGLALHRLLTALPRR